MPTKTMTTGCCIAGGGPAGMMLGYLLARAGVEVTVLEKHADFLRDFRGDTIHPSTLEIMSELGLLDAFLTLPHQKVYELTAQIGEDRVTLADFSHLPSRCRFIAFMPQWDFLDFLADQAKLYPNFALRMQAEVTDLLRRTARSPACRRVPDGTLRCRRTSSSAPTAALGGAGMRLSKSPTTGRPCSDASRRDGSSSCSTAASIGNAPS